MLFLFVFIPIDLTPAEQQLLLEIRRRKTELLHEIQVTPISYIFFPAVCDYSRGGSILFITDVEEYVASNTFVFVRWRREIDAFRFFNGDISQCFSHHLSQERKYILNLDRSTLDSLSVALHKYFGSAITCM